MKKSITSLNNKILIDILRKERISKGVNQEELGKRLDKPQSFISKIETGERRLDLIEFVTIIKKLDADPINVFGKFLDNFVDED